MQWRCKIQMGIIQCSDLRQLGSRASNPNFTEYLQALKPHSVFTLLSPVFQDRNNKGAFRRCTSKNTIIEFCLTAEPVSSTNPNYAEIKCNMLTSKHMQSVNKLRQPKTVVMNLSENEAKKSFRSSK